MQGRDDDGAPFAFFVDLAFTLRDNELARRPAVRQGAFIERQLDVTHAVGAALRAAKAQPSVKGTPRTLIRWSERIECAASEWAERCDAEVAARRAAQGRRGRGDDWEHAAQERPREASREVSETWWNRGAGRHGRAGAILSDESALHALLFQQSVPLSALTMKMRLLVQHQKLGMLLSMPVHDGQVASGQPNSFRDAAAAWLRPPRASADSIDSSDRSVAKATAKMGTSPT